MWCWARQAWVGWVPGVERGSIAQRAGRMSESHRVKRGWGHGEWYWQHHVKCQKPSGWGGWQQEGQPGDAQRPLAGIWSQEGEEGICEGVGSSGDGRLSAFIQGIKLVNQYTEDNGNQVFQLDKEGTNVEREKNSVKLVVVDWNWRYQCECMVFNILIYEYVCVQICKLMDVLTSWEDSCHNVFYIL